MSSLLTSYQRELQSTGGTMKLKEIEEHFNALSSPKKIAILWEALDEMQHYKRSRMDCVAIAMGYTRKMEGDDWKEEQ
jgi:hypothetical protein